MEKDLEEYIEKKTVQPTPPKKPEYKIPNLTVFSNAFINKKLPTLTTKHVFVITSKHLPQLKILFNDTAKLIFGNVDIYKIIYNSYLSLGITNPDGEIVGAVSLMNHPNVLSIPPWSWLEWMRNLFGCESVTQRNSLWIHLLLWKERYAKIFLKPILQYFFKNEIIKEFVMIAVPPGVKNVNCLGAESSRILPKNHLNPLTTTTLGMMARQNYVINYKIRRAVEEDNDDLVPLISKFAPSLQEIYGDYYIAELLTRFPNTTRNMIVAEYEGIAVAVVIMNQVVNYDVLNENFEVVTFHGLRKPHDDDSVGRRFSMDYTFCVEETQGTNKLNELPKLHEQASDIFHHTIAADEEMEEIDEYWKFSESVVELFVPSAHDVHTVSEHTVSRRTIETMNSSSITSLTSNRLNFDDYDTHLYRERHHNLSTSMLFENKSENAGSRPIPKFYGAENAFFLEVVASKEGHEDALELLIEASFESYPDRNYCCITIPSTHPHLAFLRRFVRVSPRVDSKFAHELYVLHRNTVQPEIYVRMAIKEDRPYIDEFLEQMINFGPFNDRIDFVLSTEPGVENSSNLCFLLIAYNQIVGIALLNEDIERDYLVSHYATYKWVDEKTEVKGCYAVIENLLLYPTFQNFTSFFLTQIHCAADYSVIYYVLTSDDMSRNRTMPICNAIQQFIPIMPRNVQDYSPAHLKGDLMPPEHITRKDTPFSLFLSMTRLSSIKRIEVNSRIVVVGAGVTATSFLESLICTTSPQLLVTFTNVVVVSPHGLSIQKEPNKARDMFFVERSTHSTQHLASLRAYLNYTPNIMTEIRRQDKIIIMNDGTFLPYDVLVILAGEQYQAPALKKGGYSDIPSNVFVINTDMDATYSLKKLSELIAKDTNPEGKVIVYGHDLRCHCALAALIEYGVPKDLLVFVNPISRTFDVENSVSYDNMIYDDPNIEMVITEILKREGITLYQGFFNDWSLNLSTNSVNQVKFECAQRLLKLPCKCIFIYTHKYISKKTFQAIVNCGLVFDGRLVIDANFRTNDPNIYAAGTVTKYSRKYHADHMTHIYYNPEEIGHKLGKYIREKLIPDEFKPKEVEKKVDFPFIVKKRKDSLPTFTQPIIKSCTVVGDLKYCHITKPGKQIPSELKVTKPNYGKLYITGDLHDLRKQGYFRIHVNEFKIVQSITCLSINEINVNNLLNVWGKHISLLNNLQLRYELMMIPDFYEFFKEPWTCAIFYDRFREIHQIIGQILQEAVMKTGKTLPNIIYEYLLDNNWEHLDKEQKKEIQELFNESDLREQIEKKLIEYIEANRVELPMYAHPNLIRSILHDYEKSAMFSE